MLKTATYYAAYIVKKLWMLAAVLLVCVAVLLSVLRYTLPYLDEQKGQLEGWLSAQYGVELAIGEMSAGWSGIGPTLLLNNVTLKQNEQSPIELDIDQTQIELDFWGTVLARQIQSRRFEMSGLNVTLDIGRIKTSDADFPIVEALESLFLVHLQRFSVEDSQLLVKTLYDEQLIEIQQLSWINRDNRHQGVGELRVVELARNSAYFALDLFGEKDDLNGTFYAKGEALDISPWLNQFVRTQSQLTESRGNFVFWAAIEKSHISGVQMDLNNSRFSWSTPTTSIVTEILDGELSAVPDINGWRINVNNLAFQSGGRSLVSSWDGFVDHKGHGRFNSLRAMDVEALLPVLPLVLDPQTAELVDRLSPHARIDEVAVTFDKASAAYLRFSDMGWNQVDALPGLDDLYGEIHWFDEIGHVSVRGDDSQLQINNLLEDNIAYRTLTLDAYLQSGADGVTLDIPELHFDSPDVELKNAIRYTSADNMLSIGGQIASLDMPQIKKLFPTEAMGVETRAYLVRALQEGQLNDAQLLWHGSPQAFPFDDNEGIFQATVSLSDVTLSFDSTWPAVSELDIQLLFENEGLYMHSEKGRLMGASIGVLDAAIPELADGATLTIDADIAALASDLTTLMKASSLADSVGSVLETGVQVSGPLQAKLTLHIPLSGEDVVADGYVYLNDNPVFVPSVGIEFENARGAVHFVNDKVEVSGLEANLIGQPVALSFDGIGVEGKGYQANIDIAGDWQIEPLLETYHPGFIPFLQGGSGWKTEVDLLLSNRGYDYQYEATLLSNLEGVQSTLPAPFDKLRDATKTFEVQVEGNNQASNIVARLGKEVAFTGILPHRELQFSRAHLALGDSEFVGLGLGFSISADLPELHFEPWFAAINALVGDLPGSEKPVLGQPQRVYVNTNKLILAGQQLDDVKLVARHNSEDWQLDVNADQTRAEVILYGDWLDRGIDVNADFIHLDKWQKPQAPETETETVAKDYSQLPPMTFVCKSCVIEGINLGHIDFAMSRTQTGMQIDRLQLNQQDGRLLASGDWFISESGNSTRLKGELNSGDFGSMLKQFGLDSGIKDSGAEFDFDLSWQGAPQEFGFATLNGNVDWRLSDGYLTELSDKGLRIFSILSLQTLVRKLSGDFRDIFAQGFFYDKMSGSFQLHNGRANTSDMVIDGGAGEMTIAGYTDLSSRELNYQIGFTPNVTSSLPLLVYFMTNPGTAIAALAIDQVLTEAKVISHVRYSVTGTLDAPVTEQIDKKSKDISLPAQNRPAPQTGPEALLVPEKPKSPLPVLESRINVGVSEDG